ncbi:hypothetical protein JM16_000133 [Phytophthora kernoviae]|uniref:Uncharacterized protein n=1 Tax=Phytophthora kernoviae TaxID=325452 RepID=A0A8T0MBV8_9STRA|nr:hypothetical protein JM16_000133 [Phytophthora kernoviae]
MGSSQKAEEAETELDDSFRTIGEVIMEFQNPSYCSPDIGPLNITFTKKRMSFLSIQVPAFELQSGVTTIVSAVGFELLTTPEILYNMVFTDEEAIDIRGVVPVLLDLVDVKVKVPAKIDNKPAFLREYSISPTLKELDSKTHKCLLELKVVIKINNPLPINFDLFGIELDLLYEKESDDNGVLSDDSNSTFLLHISDTKHVSWSSHEENSIVLDSAVHDFDTCMEVVGFYLHNQLAFDIEHGHIAMGAGSGNFSIPFSVKGIHIHPGAPNVSV